jgi:serine/threonine protein kinase
MRNSVLGQRYRILDRLGEGGMANVYRALDEKLGRYVAVKILHDHLRRNPDIRSRFQQEAQAVSTLDHPNIMRIYDFSGPEHEQLWLVAELVSGTTLANLQQSRPDRRLPEIVAACIVREITRALEHAHKSGIVHRDIKPENVMVTQDGRLKLMDFGIAKDTHNHRKTQTGMFMGSPSYMSPEQVRGRNIDARSDICSLGVVFYELLTGRLPYEGTSSADVIEKIGKGDFVYPRFRTHGLSMEVDRIVVRCLQKNPEARFQSTTELGNAIDAWLATQTVYSSAMELESYMMRGTTRAPESFASASGSGIAPSNNPVTREPEAHTPPRKTKVRTAQPRRISKDDEARPLSPVNRPARPPARPDRPATRQASQRRPQMPRRQVVVVAREPSQTPVFLAILVAIVMAVLWATDFKVLRQATRNVPATVTQTPPTPQPPATKAENPKVAPAQPAPAPDSQAPVTETAESQVAPAAPPAPAKKPPKKEPRKVVRETWDGRDGRESRDAIEGRDVPDTAPRKPDAPAIPAQSTAPATPVIQAPAGKGRIAISSQPAAEIYINNRKAGTTVDAGSSSGWIAVDSGPVTITLRRSGYRDLVKKITVARDDRITIGILTLDRDSGKSSPRATETRPLTITTNRWPAVVTITTTGGGGSNPAGAPMKFRLEQATKTVRLPAGRHTIRVEANGEVKERRIDTTAISGGITYSVEFSGPSTQKTGMPGGERQP